MSGLAVLKAERVTENIEENYLLLKLSSKQNSGGFTE